LQGFIVDKLRSELNDPVEYTLLLDEGEFKLNEAIGSRLRMKFTGNAGCTHCGRKQVFKQGYCFPCTQTLAQCDFCILSPEKCHFHEGTCRDEEFAKTHCFIPHLVYLSLSSHVKVGLTRKGNENIRWVDQGAVGATPLLELEDRKTAGEAETLLKELFSDKTSWQRMLKESPDRYEDLEEAYTRAVDFLAEKGMKALEYNLTKISYPIESHPAKVKSYNPKKIPELEDELQGIKGQYLIFSNGVLNMRNWQGYEIILEEV